MATPRTAAEFISNFPRHPATISVADQILISSGSFLASVYVGRYADSAVYGLYALVYLTAITCADYHRAAIWMPMSIVKKDVALYRPTRRLALSGAGMVATCILLVALGIFFFNGSATRVFWVSVALSPTIVLVTTHEIQRRIVFCLVKPHIALISDSGYLLGVVMALVVGSILLDTTQSAALFGISSLAVGATVGLIIASSTINELPVGHKLSVIVRTYLPIGKWFIFSNLLMFASHRMTLFVLGSFAGLSAMANMEAARLIASPLQVIALGVTSHTVPGLARAFHAGGRQRMQKFMARWTALFIALTSCYLLLVLTGWSGLSHLLLKKTFDHTGFLVIAYCLVATNSAILTLVVIAMGAIGQAKLSTMARVPAAAISLAVAVPTAVWFGERGIACLMVLEGIVSVLIMLACLRYATPNDPEHRRFPDYKQSTSVLVNK